VFRYLLASAATLAYTLGFAQPAMVSIVAPQYPAPAQQRGEGATVEVEGQVNPNGTIDMAGLKLTGAGQPFVAAVREVAPFWMFRPAIDPVSCESRAEALRMQVIFEIAGGQPSVSVTNPSAGTVEGSPGTASRRSGKMPYYPRAAQKAGQEAEVLAVAKVDAMGTVWNVHLRPGRFNATFNTPVQQALIGWQIDVPNFPAGRTHVCVQVPIEFQLTHSKISGEAARLKPLVLLP
jgi:TonB family protein